MRLFHGKEAHRNKIIDSDMNEADVETGHWDMNLMGIRVR